MATVVRATAYGGPEVLQVSEIDVREPGPGEAKIAVRAVGVNPVDYKLYSGARGQDPDALPLPVGAEAAGVVTAVGTGAVGPAGPLAVGDEVIAFRAPGAYASEYVAPGSTFVPKPSTLDFEQAAGILLVGATATHLLAVTRVGAGDTVLLHGASGGVGLIAIQLVQSLGAVAVATASAPRHDLLRDYGAIPVTYGNGLADRVRAAAPDGIDVALDLVGTDEAIDVSLELVADRSRIASIAAYHRAPAEGVALLGGAPGADPGLELRDAARLDLVEAAQAGKLRVLVTRRYPLVEAAQAHRDLMTGHTVGKTVLIP